MSNINDPLKEKIYKHISTINSPITTSEVACAMGITNQKASAFLKQLCFEERIIWKPYHSQRRYGLKETFAKHTSNSVCNENNNKIDIEIIVENENNTVEFEFNTTKESYKDKFLSLLYNIIYDYFY